MGYDYGCEVFADSESSNACRPAITGCGKILYTINA